MVGVAVCDDARSLSVNWKRGDTWRMRSAKTYDRSTLLLDLFDHRPVVRPLSVKGRRLLRVPADPHQGSVSGPVSNVGHVVEERNFQGVGVRSDCGKVE